MRPIVYSLVLTAIGCAPHYADREEAARTCASFTAYQQKTQEHLQVWDPVVFSLLSRISFVGEPVLGHEHAGYNPRTHEMTVNVLPSEPLERRLVTLDAVDHELGHRVFEYFGEKISRLILAEEDPSITSEERMNRKLPSGYSAWNWFVFQESLEKYKPAACVREYLEVGYVIAPKIVEDTKRAQEYYTQAKELLEVPAFSTSLTDAERKSVEQYRNRYEQQVVQIGQKNDAVTDQLAALDLDILQSVCISPEPQYTIMQNSDLSLFVASLRSEGEMIPAIYVRVTESAPSANKDLGDYRASMNYLTNLGRFLSDMQQPGPEDITNELFARAVTSLMQLYTGPTTYQTFRLDESILSALEEIDVEGVFIFEEPVHRYRQALDLSSQGVSEDAIRRKILRTVTSPSVQYPQMACFETKADWWKDVEEKLLRREE